MAPRQRKTEISLAVSDALQRIAPPLPAGESNPIKLHETAASLAAQPSATHCKPHFNSTEFKPSVMPDGFVVQRRHGRRST